MTLSKTVDMEDKSMEFHISEKDKFRYKPLPFFFLTTCEPDEYTDEKVEASLAELKECGFGGLILFNKPPKGFNKENYLSDDVISDFSSNL